ncbi:MAG: restriction endonuclease subunit S [Pseudomonadota bacterium]
MSSEWPIKTVGEFCPFKYGKNLPERDRKKGHYGVYSSAGLVGSHDSPYVKSPGVVIGRKGTVGSVTYSACPFWPIDTAFFIEDEPDVRDVRFTYYLLRTLGLHLMNTDSAVPGLNRDNAHALEVRVPPLSIQKIIADFLQYLDDRITLLRETNATFEAIAQALFKSWFVDFDPVRAKMEGRVPEGMDEATAALFPDSLEETELGEVPRGWRVTKFEDFILRISVGKKFDQKTAKLQGHVPILDQGKSGVIGYHDEDPGVRASLEDPVVVFANHTCYMRLIPYDFSAIQNVLPFRGKGIDTVWAYYATQGRVKFSEYKGHWPDFAIEKAVVPNKLLGEVFRSVVDPMMRKVRANELHVEMLIGLRDGLLPRLISGQLRLTKSACELVVN